MSATGIVFLALSVVMLGLGFYGASVDVVSATGLAESIGQMKNFYFLLGGLILFIVLYRTAFAKASLRVQHAMSTTIRYIILIGVGVFMVYPLLWMISATFKDNNEIFSTLSLIPTRPTMEGYKAAMNNYGGDINIWQAMLNTYKYVIPKVIFTVVSSTITAYGFGRFRFRGRRTVLDRDRSRRAGRRRFARRNAALRIARHRKILPGRSRPSTNRRRATSRRP